MWAGQDQSVNGIRHERSKEENHHPPSLTFLGGCLPLCSTPFSLFVCLSLYLCTFFPKALKIVQDASLPILEGEALRLLCVADSNPPAQLSWFRGSRALNTVLISRTAILELPHVGAGEEGQFTCQARHPLGSQSISLSLSVVCECGDPWGQDLWILEVQEHC